MHEIIAGGFFKKEIYSLFLFLLVGFLNGIIADIERYRGRGVMGLYQLLRQGGLCRELPIGFCDNPKVRPILDFLMCGDVIDSMVTPSSVETTDTSVLLELLESTSYLPDIAVKNAFRRREILWSIFSGSRLSNITIDELSKIIAILASIAPKEIADVFRDKDVLERIICVLDNVSPQDIIAFICSIATASLDLFKIVMGDLNFQNIIKKNLVGENILDLFIGLSRLNVNCATLKQVLRFTFGITSIARSLEEALYRIRLSDRLIFFEQIASESEILEVFPVDFIKKFVFDPRAYPLMTARRMVYAFLQIHSLLGEHSYDVMSRLSKRLMAKLRGIKRLFKRIRLLSRLGREIDIHRIFPENFIIWAVYDRKEYESWSPEMLVNALAYIRALGSTYNHIVSQIRDLISKIITKPTRFPRLLSILEKMRELSLLSFVPRETLFSVLYRPDIFGRVPLEKLVRILCRIYYISVEVFSQMLSNIEKILAEKIKVSILKELIEFFSVKKEPWLHILEHLSYDDPERIYMQAMKQILESKEIRNVLKERVKESRSFSRVLRRFLGLVGLERREKKGLKWAEIKELIDTIPSQHMGVIDIYRKYREKLGPILVWLVVAKIKYGEEMMKFLRCMSPYEAAAFIQIIETKECIEREIPIEWDSIEKLIRYNDATGLANAIEKNPWVLDRYMNEIILAIRKKSPYVKELIIYALMKISRRSRKAIEILHVLEGDQDIADVVIRCLTEICEITQQWRNHKRPDAIRSALEKKRIEIVSEYRAEKSLPICHIVEIPPWKQPKHYTLKSISWSPDGKFLLCHAIKSPMKNIVEIWRNNELILSIDNISNPSWSPNGEYILAKESGALVMIDPKDFRIVKRFMNDEEIEVRLAEWSKDGDKILAITAQNDIYIINVDGDYRRIDVDLKEDVSISWACWSPDGSKIIIASDKRIMLLEEERNEWYMKNEVSFESKIYMAMWSPTDNRIAVSLSNGTILILNDELAVMKRLGKISKNMPCSIEWSKNGVYLACLAKRHVYIIDMRTGRKIWILRIPSTQLYTSPPPRRGISWGPNNTLATVGKTNIYLWNIGGGHIIRRLGYYMSHVVDIECSPDGRYVACLSNDATIHIWDTSTLQEIAIIRAPKPLNQIKWSPNYRYIAGSSKNHIYLWEIREMKLYKKIKCRNIISTTWNPSGEKIAYSSKRGLHIYDVERDELQIVHLNVGYLENLSWSPNGKYIAAIVEPKTISIIDTDKWREIHRIEKPKLTREDRNLIREYIYEIRMAPEEFKYCLCWSPDGEKLVCGDSLGIIAAQKVRSNRQVFKYINPGSESYSVAWSPDGKYIAVVSFPYLMIFSVDRNKAIAVSPLLPHEIIWSPNGKYMAARVVGLDCSFILIFPQI